MAPPNDLQIVASFVMNEAGEPKREAAGNVSAYWISITIRGAPSDTYSVTYKLDPTYYDPIVEVTTKHNEFNLEFTSYGDYAIGAIVRTRSFTYTVSRRLYEALKETHGQDLRRTVLEALEGIRRN